MAIEFLITNLEDIDAIDGPNGFDGRITNELKEALTRRRFEEMKELSRKREKAHRITTYFNQVYLFSSKDYLSRLESYLFQGPFNNDCITSIDRGIRMQGVPIELIHSLTFYERLYFFAGIEAISGPHEIMDAKPYFDLDRAHPLVPGLDCMTLHEMVSIYIRAGIDRLTFLGNKKKKRRPNKAYAWFPPLSSKIRKQLLKKEEIYQKTKQR